MEPHWGAIIKQYRSCNKLSQAALAAHVGVNQKTVSRWENDIDPPRLKHQKRLRDLIYKPVDDIAVLAVKHSAALRSILRCDNPYFSIVHSAEAAAQWGATQAALDNRSHEHVIPDHLKQSIWLAYEQSCAVGVHNLAFSAGVCLTPNAPYDGIHYTSTWQKIGTEHFEFIDATPLKNITLKDCFYTALTFDELTEKNLTALRRS